ncbi:MAG: mannose-1-phosphate guanylyltransferase/mannose-6-phosphate isomerase [Thermodesulfobacteriota bacterium]
MAKKSGGLYAVILAGGIGSRFWPLSRATSPKQLLKIAGDESLLKETIKRLAPLIPPSSVSIVTNSSQAEIIRLHLSQGKKASPVKIVAEPSGKNTAPAIALAAMKVFRKNPEAIMAVLPADHIIGDAPAFRKTLKAAVEAAELGALVTFGVKPKSPHTGYGYIKAKAGVYKKVGAIKVRKVERFVEKPKLEKAKEFLKEGGYFWNSGIFVWKASAILEEMKTHLPSLYKSIMSIRSDEDVISAYSKIEAISIDNGVLEKSKNVVVIEADFSWSDMGSWSSMSEVFAPDASGNIMKGRVVDIGSKDSLVIGSDRLVATIGLKDMIIVDTPDATLVCPKTRAQEVKDIVSILKKKGYVEHEIHTTVERPWGAYTVLETGDHYKIKKIRVFPGCRLSLQLHNKRSEHWVVIAGEAKVQRGEESVTVRVNESTYIPRGVKHRLENTSPDAMLEIIEVSNGDYIGEDDIVRFDDDYERQGQGS